MAKQNAIANKAYALTADTTVTGLTLRTSPATSYASIAGTTITGAGTDPNVNIGITTQGTGELLIDTLNGGGISFRGITAGYLVTRYHTQQRAVQTNDATPTAILTIPLVADLMVSVKALVNGFQSDYTDCLGGEIMVTAYRPTAGNVTLVGAPIINVNYTDLVNTSDIDALVDVGTQSLIINVIGVAAQTWNWVTTVDYMYTINHL